jgi:hypothetical protein
VSVSGSGGVVSMFDTTEKQSHGGTGWGRMDGRLMAYRKSPALGGSVNTKGDV